MKIGIKLAIGAVLVGCGVAFAVGLLERTLEQKSDPASMLPEGALMAVEAKDFRALLHDWNSSQEKRTWLRGNNYSDFSRSRLFERLSQAQDEFAAVATINPDAEMLDAIAGKQSCLGLYDIGRLEFVYITRMDNSRIQMLPLWQARGKFERRNEAGTDFYLRRDAKTDRQAAFAARDGWLILGTREDLVAGVLDRIAGKMDRNLASEAWFADTVKQAGNRGELRMVLNLSKIVPTPYFRSYWIQQNVTEMKQYTSAVSDLNREGSVYREERVLVRRDGDHGNTSAGTQDLYNLAPDNSVLTIAQAASSPDQVLKSMREDLLEMHAAQESSTHRTAPGVMMSDNYGTASQLDVNIDQTPLVESRVDAYEALHTLLSNMHPVHMMRCYTSESSNGDVFVALHAAMVTEAGSNWNEDATRNAITAALSPDTTVSRLGAQWKKRSGRSVDYMELDGPITLYLKAEGNKLFLATDANLMESLLSRVQSASASSGEAQSFQAIFRNAHGRSDFIHLLKQLESAGSHSENGSDGASDTMSSENGGDQDAVHSEGNGRDPGFFSGNIGGLMSAFARLDSEEVSEKDLGSKVLQTITYRWKN